MGTQVLYSFVPMQHDLGRTFSMLVFPDMSVTRLEDTVTVEHNDGIDVARFRVRGIAAIRVWCWRRWDISRRAVRRCCTWRPTWEP